MARDPLDEHIMMEAAAQQASRGFDADRKAVPCGLGDVGESALGRSSASAGLAGSTVHAQTLNDVSLLLPADDGLMASLGTLRVGFAAGSETHRLIGSAIDSLGVLRLVVNEERKRASVLYEFINREREKGKALQQRLDLARFALSL